MSYNLNVFYTVDVEVAPSLYMKHGLEEAFQRSIHGRTAEGDYGLAYQMKVLNDHNLKGTFFVEPLF